jgi:hypothetical protein
MWRRLEMLGLRLLVWRRHKAWLHGSETGVMLHLGRVASWERRVLRVVRGGGEVLGVLGVGGLKVVDGVGVVVVWVGLSLVLVWVGGGMTVGRLGGDSSGSGIRVGIGVGGIILSKKNWRVSCLTPERAREEMRRKEWRLTTVVFLDGRVSSRRRLTSSIVAVTVASLTSSISGSVALPTLTSIPSSHPRSAHSNPSRSSRHSSARSISPISIVLLVCSPPGHPNILVLLFVQILVVPVQRLGLALIWLEARKASSRRLTSLSFFLGSDGFDAGLVGVGLIVLEAFTSGAAFTVSRPASWHATTAAGKCAAGDLCRWDGRGMGKLRI